MFTPRTVVSPTAGTVEALSLTLGEDALGKVASLPVSSTVTNAPGYMFARTVSVTNGVLSAVRTEEVRDINFEVSAYDALRNVRCLARLQEPERLALFARDVLPSHAGRVGEWGIGVPESVAESTDAIAKGLPDGRVLERDHAPADMRLQSAGPANRVPGEIPAGGPVRARHGSVLQPHKLPCRPLVDERLILFLELGDGRSHLRLCLDNEIQPANAGGILESAFVRHGVAHLLEHAFKYAARRRMVDLARDELSADVADPRKVVRRRHPGREYAAAEDVRGDLLADFRRAERGRQQIFYPNDVLWVHDRLDSEVVDEGVDAELAAELHVLPAYLSADAAEPLGERHSDLGRGSAEIVPD